MSASLYTTRRIKNIVAMILSVVATGIGVVGDSLRISRAGAVRTAAVGPTRSLLAGSATAQDWPELADSDYSRSSRI